MFGSVPLSGRRPGLGPGAKGWPGPTVRGRRDGRAGKAGSRAHSHPRHALSRAARHLSRYHVPGLGVKTELKNRVMRRYRGAAGVHVVELAPLAHLKSRGKTKGTRIAPSLMIASRTPVSSGRDGRSAMLPGVEQTDQMLQRFSDRDNARRLAPRAQQLK
jgi:hypothetical protein